MSKKTRNTRATVTTGTARALQAVPDQSGTTTVRTDAEDKLWAALHAQPHSTSASLALDAKIGRSTAQKILAKWEDEGTVIRTPGIAEGGRRAADVWAITEPSTTAKDAALDTADGGIDDGTDESTVEGPPDNTPATEPTVDDTASTDTARDPLTTVPVVPDSADAATTASHATQDTVGAADDVPQEASDGGQGQMTNRLPSGALRGMVEDHLRSHPGQDFSPVAIARALDGKSSGAVSNALDKLVAAGVAVMTQDKPKRFALASAEHVSGAAAKR